MANCLACSKLERRSKAGIIRYYCGLGGGEIAPEDLKPKPGALSVPVCAFDGPYTDTEERIMADRIDWKQEYDGKPLWQAVIELREVGLAWAGVADEVNEVYDLQVTPKMCQAKYYYYRKRKQASPPASAQAPAIAEKPHVPSALDNAGADQPELLDTGGVTGRGLAVQGLAVRTEPAYLMLQIPGVRVVIEAETQEVLVARMGVIEKLFAAVGTVTRTA